MARATTPTPDHNHQLALYLIRQHSATVRIGEWWWRRFGKPLVRPSLAHSTNRRGRLHAVRAQLGPLAPRRLDRLSHRRQRPSLTPIPPDARRNLFRYSLLRFPPASVGIL